MNILVTGANGQLGNEMRIVCKSSSDNYIFTDVNQAEGVDTTYLDITDLDAIRRIVNEMDVKAIVNCAAWTSMDASEYSSPVKRPSYRVLDKKTFKDTFGGSVPYWVASLEKCIHNLKQQTK